jgi:hypothetical protein
MSFLTPAAPKETPPPPPPAAPQMASNAIKDAGAQSRAAAAAAAGGMGFDNSVLTGPQGASKTSTTGGKSTLGDA